MLKITKLIQKEGSWMIKGSSELFDTREQALERATMQKPLSKAQEGRRFLSENLQRFFRSHWEIELAELMTELGITFEYEPQRFYYRAERESYLPDFYLPEFDVWIEVKGFMDKRSLKRVKLFKKYQGQKYGFFLYEKEERELVLKNPELLFVYIQIAQEENKKKRGVK